MTDPTTDTIARMIRSAPDPTSPEGSQELAERVIENVRALDEQPELEEVRHPPRPVRVDPVQVSETARRIRDLVQARELGENSPSATRRFFAGLVELLEEVGAYVVGVAIQKLREELEERG